MKWKNKGHEIERFYKDIKQTEIFIFGAGQMGTRLFQLIKDDWSVLGFVDNNCEKRKTEYLGKKVFSFEELQRMRNKRTIVVVAAGAPNKNNMANQLREAGFSEYQDFYFMEQFVAISLWICHKKVYVLNCTISATERCSLNCRDCSVLTPFLKGPKHLPLEDLKRDADTLFHAVDFILDFGILGGEPFIYPWLAEILEYIGMHYRDQIKRFVITTNACATPTEQIVSIIKKYDITVSVSDYRDALPQMKQTIDRFLLFFEEHQVPITLLHADTWYDFGYRTTDRCSASDAELTSLFNACRMPCHLMKDGRFYYCANHKFAVNAGFLDEQENEGFCLENLKEEDKAAFVEYSIGYSEKGYVGLCRYCNGYLLGDEHDVPVAVQEKAAH